MKHSRIIFVCFAFLLLPGILPAVPQSPNTRKPALIRDTGTAEGKDNSTAEQPKERNPSLAEQNLNIGNFYFKRRNYPAAIQRYIEAIEYQGDLGPAHDALARAYEKTGEIDKAIDTYKNFIAKYPRSPSIEEFRSKLAKIEKKPD